MPTVADFFHNALLILVIIALFNVIIFVHELGHFLAAKWRGLKIERFQIWFGRPLWKKEINGVQYGLGWIPAGGFVALPQMAPMEAIEGGNSERAVPLAPISPRDKIIVAIAGPLFSLLLAFAAGAVVWKSGKPHDLIPTQVIGEVLKGGPGEKAGLRAGDKILAINGKPVQGFAGNLDCIVESVVLSRGDQIHFTVERGGEAKPLELVSRFEIRPTKWWQRRGLRQVGITPLTEVVLIDGVVPNSPAARAGLQADDRIVSLNGEAITTSKRFIELARAAGTAELTLVIERKDEPIIVKLAAKLPKQAPEMRPQLGLACADAPVFDKHFVYPSPWAQVRDSARMMWTTLDRLVSRDSSIGIDQMSGPVGVAKAKFQLLKSDYPFQRVMWFMVVFNVNLAIFNMLPLPVLDGGHITLAVMEWITRRPARARVLEVIQTVVAFLLIGLFLYITSKDVVGDVGGEKPKPIPVEFEP